MGHAADVARFLVFLALVLVSPLSADEKQPPPNLTRVVALINTSIAHACPVSADFAVTARHVALRESIWQEARPAAFRGSNAEWVGYLDFAGASDYEDAGLLKVEVPFPSWYPVATKAPATGDLLWWVGFDWRKPSVAFSDRVFSGKVVRVIAGIIIMEEPTPPGSSGSCVLNAAGEVVGIVSFGKDLENGQEVAGFVGLWTPWFRVPEAPKPELIAPPGQ